MPNPKLSNRIRVYRAEYRLSQADLAKAIGVSRKTISTIEVGRFVPSTVIALKIARFFNVPVEEIFSLENGDACPSDNSHGGSRCNTTRRALRGLPRVEAQRDVQDRPVEERLRAED